MLSACQDAQLCLQRVKGLVEQVQEPNARAVIEETLDVIELLVQSVEEIQGEQSHRNHQAPQSATISSMLQT